MIALIAGEASLTQTNDVLNMFGITAVCDKPPQGRGQTAWQHASSLLPVVENHKPDHVLLFNGMPDGPSYALCKLECDGVPIWRNLV